VPCNPRRDRHELDACRCPAESRDCARHMLTLCDMTAWIVKSRSLQWWVSSTRIPSSTLRATTCSRLSVRPCGASRPHGGACGGAEFEVLREWKNFQWPTGVV